MNPLYPGEALHERFKDVGEFVKQECYDNTFWNIHRLNDDDNIQVVFAWVQILKDENLYTRHACYLIDDEILDLTLYHVRGNFEYIRNTKYYPIKIFTKKEYLKAMSVETELNGTTGLIKYLEKEDNETRKWMFEQGYITI